MKIALLVIGALVVVLSLLVLFLLLAGAAKMDRDWEDDRPWRP